MAIALSDDLREIARLVPGYDPFRTAGDCWFDEDKAQGAIDFIEDRCSHIEGSLAGQRFILEPWEKAVVANLFGWYRPDGTRRYREMFLFVPRKNGKTPLCAAISCVVLFTDEERGQQNYCAAAEREQASLVYRHIVGMIENDPELAGICQIYRGSKTVLRNFDQSFLKVISADAHTKHGGNSHLIIIDELHAQPNRELVDVLQTSLASANRLQPLMISLSTSDYEREGSICNEKHDYACKVRDGIRDDVSFLPVIFEASIEDDWKDPATWAKANPNLGVSVSEDYLRRECQRAIESPTYENTFKRLHLNIRTEQDVRWLSMDRWDQCKSSFREEDLRDMMCWFSLDLSTTTDVTALTKCYRCTETSEYWLVPHFWIPEARARERENRDRVPYLTWAKQGLVTLTPGDAVDYSFVRADVNKFASRCQLQELSADPWNATHLLQEMQHDDGLPVVEHRQGYASMSGPMKEFEKAVISRKIHHDGNPVLRWMVSNVVADMDPAGNIKPNKAKSGGSGRIDGAVTSIMAVGRAAAGGGYVFDDDSVVVA